MRNTPWLIGVLIVGVAAGVWMQSERQEPRNPPKNLGGVTNQTAGTQTPDRQSPVSQGGPGQLLESQASRSQAVQQKLLENERAVATAQDRLQRIQDDIRTSDLDDQIQRQQQIVTDLQARAQNMQSQETPQLQNQALWVEQNTQVLQQRLSGLLQQIQEQQGVSSQIAQQLRNTIAPDDSDILVRLNSELEASQLRTRQLQAEYDSAVQAQQQFAANRYAAQAQEQMQHQAGRINTDVALEQAKARLEGLVRQRQQLLAAAEQGQRRIEELKAQRSELLNQS